eukprot:gene2852-31608_t
MGQKAKRTDNQGTGAGCGAWGAESRLRASVSARLRAAAACDALLALRWVKDHIAC